MNKTDEAIIKIDEMIGHMIGPYGDEPECTELRNIKKLLVSEPEHKRISEYPWTLHIAEKTKDELYKRLCSIVPDLMDGRYSKPEQGEFTKELINVWNEYLSTSTLNIACKRELCEKVNLLIGEACDRIDSIVRLTAENKDLRKLNTIFLQNSEAELKAKDEEINRLQDTVTEYGRHGDDCAMMTQKIETQPKCNCGFLKAWQG